MTVVDFIDVIDDIIELSSDEETVQQDHVTTQPRGMLLDSQAMFVQADEGKQDANPAFVSAVEGSQEATESGNALVATASPSVMEEVPLDTAAESKNCPSSPTSAALPSPISTTLKTLPSEVCDTQPVATTSPSVMEKTPLDTAESKNCPCCPASVPLPSLTSTTPKALPSEVGDTLLVATTSPSVMEKTPLDTAGSKNWPCSIVSAPLPSLTSTNPKALPSEVGETLPVATTSPSVMEKTPLDTAESNNWPCSPASAPLPSPTSTTPKALAFEVGDTKLVATASPSVMEKVHLDTAELKNCPGSPASAPLPSPASTSPKALSFEVGDKKLVRVKHLKKNYHTSTRRRSPRLRECCNNPVEELAADRKKPRMLEPAEESAAPTDNAESAKTLSTDSAN